MSERGHLEYLADMHEAIVRIQSYTSGVTYEQFLADHKTQDAVIRNIEIIGEAVKHMPTAITIAHTEVEWRSLKIASAHGCMRSSFAPAILTAPTGMPP